MKRAHFPTDAPEKYVDSLLLDTCTALRDRRNLELQNEVAGLQQQIQDLKNALFWSKYTISKIQEAWDDFEITFTDLREECIHTCPFRMHSLTPVEDCPRHARIFKVLTMLGLTWKFVADGEINIDGTVGRVEFQLCTVNEFRSDIVAAPEHDCHLVLTVNYRRSFQIALGGRLLNANVGISNPSHIELRLFEMFIRLVDWWDDDEDEDAIEHEDDCGEETCLHSKISRVDEFLQGVESTAENATSFRTCIEQIIPRDYMGWEDLSLKNE